MSRFGAPVPFLYLLKVVIPEYLVDIEIMINFLDYFFNTLSFRLSYIFHVITLGNVTPFRLFLLTIYALLHYFWGLCHPFALPSNDFQRFLFFEYATFERPISMGFILLRLFFINNILSDLVFLRYVQFSMDVINL